MWHCCWASLQTSISPCWFWALSISSCVQSWIGSVMHVSARESLPPPSHRSSCPNAVINSEKQPPHWRANAPQLQKSHANSVKQAPGWLLTSPEIYAGCDSIFRGSPSVTRVLLLRRVSKGTAVKRRACIWHGTSLKYKKWFILTDFA